MEGHHLPGRGLHLATAVRFVEVSIVKQTEEETKNRAGIDQDQRREGER